MTLLDCQRTRAGLRAKSLERAKVSLFFAPVFAVALGVGACAHKARPYSASEAVGALRKQASQVRTASGRAWVKARGPDQKTSFPAVIVVDRTVAEAPLLRIEAIDPFGATHGLMILDRSRNLTWIDYDQNRVQRLKTSWYGVPLTRLPELVLGLAPLGGQARVTGASATGFTAREGRVQVNYEMTWIDPGPRLALVGLVGRTDENAAAESFVVDYSKYLDHDEFYLPSEVSIKGYGGSRNPGGNADFDLEISWRERRWNEAVPSALFEVPKN